MKELPVRKKIRLKGYDYSQSGYYFITICVKNGHELFGKIIDGKNNFTEYGAIAERNLIDIPIHVKNITVDKYVVMPNHVHIIMIVTDNTVGTRYIASDPLATDADKRTPFVNNRTPYMASLQAKSKQTVSKAVQQYKASVSRDTIVSGLWQQRFHDYIIRNEEEYRRIWQYIDENPARWEEDYYFVK